MDQVSKAIKKRHEDLLNKQYSMMGGDALEKGAKAEEGEVRTWNGQKFKKTGQKWTPVTDGKDKGSKPEPGDKEGGKPDAGKPSGGSQPSSHDVAQLTTMKNMVDAGNHDKAYEIYQQLSPEAQGKVPQDVVNKLVENNHADKPDAAGSNPFDSDGDGKSEGASKHSDTVSKEKDGRVKSFIEKNKELFDTGEHTHPERSKLSKFLRGKMKGLIKGFKHEIEHMKEAAVGLKKLVTGKKLNDHEKGALKKVGISLGLTIATMVATGGTGIFAHGAGEFFSHLGVHFVEHAALETTGLAMIFAKGDAPEDGVPSDEENDAAAKDVFTDENLEKIMNAFVDFIEKGDWSGMLDGVDSEDGEDDSSKKPSSDMEKGHVADLALSRVNSFFNKKLQ